MKQTAIIDCIELLYPDDWSYEYRLHLTNCMRVDTNKKYKEWDEIEIEVSIVE